MEKYFRALIGKYFIIMTYETLIKIGISVHYTRENVHNDYINLQ